MHTLLCAYLNGYIAKPLYIHLNDGAVRTCRHDLVADTLASTVPLNSLGHPVAPEETRGVFDFALSMTLSPTKSLFYVHHLSRFDGLTAVFDEFARSCARVRFRMGKYCHRENYKIPSHLYSV